MTDIPRTAPRTGGPSAATALATRTRAQLRRTAVHLWTENVADHAAALTYYAVLALLPALVIAVSLVGLLGEATRDRLIAAITSYAPPQSAQVLSDALGSLSADRSSIWALLISGVLSALWSACSYLAVFRRALHTMHRVPDTRPPLRAAHTLVINALLLVLVFVGAVGLVVGGGGGRGGAPGTGRPRPPHGGRVGGGRCWGGWGGRGGERGARGRGPGGPRPPPGAPARTSWRCCAGPCRWRS
ncbi:YihY/virulence factor BrkB family protein [Streptomyces sp. NPDC059552]|uniref:YihY/virulence factor BrkB family protein n=1 Tax=Streptomyces sp. NPDC059552 TaxID=3346862 RepID=UPI0036ACDE29